MAHLISAVHPAAVLRGGRPISDVIASDLGKAWRISQEGPHLEEHILHVIPGNPLGIEEAFRRAMLWMQHWRAVGAQVGVDVETSALDYFNCKLYSIALGEAESSTAVTFTLKDLHTLPATYEAALIAELTAVLHDVNVSKVFHNAPFDMAVLFHKGFYIGGNILDTQGLHHLVQPDLPHDLGWVGHTYLDCEPWKLDHESGKMANTRDPIKLLIYNARDALYTAKLVDPLTRDVTARGMPASLIGWQSAFARLASEMEIAGLPINFAKRKAMGSATKAKMIKAKQELRSFLGWNEFNPMNDNHRREVLFGEKYAKAPWKLGLEASRRTEKQNLPSTGYKSIIDHLEHPFVRSLTSYVEARMSYATLYQDGTEIDADTGLLEKPGSYQRAICNDGRLHARWKPNTLASPRFGSEPNCQNVKSVDREFIEAPEGRVFIGADKCLAKGTKIETDRGPITIQNATPERAVKSLYNGRTINRPIHAVGYTGVLPCYEIRFGNNETVTASENHKWPSVNFGDIATKDLLPGLLIQPGLPVIGMQYAGVQHTWSIQVEPFHNYLLSAGVFTKNSQLELRIVACHAGVRELLDEMAKPDGDPHRLAAMHVYGEGFLEKPKKAQKQLRDMVKNVVYASLYMAGVETVWRTIREKKQLDPVMRAAMDLKTVRHIHSSYFMRYMEILRYNEGLIREATKNGYIRTSPLGRLRYFPVRPVPATEVVNSKTQSWGADTVTSEMVMIQEELKQKYHGRAFTVLHGHDQVVIECDERDAEDCKKIVERIYCDTLLEGPAGPVRLNAKALIGKNMLAVK